MQAQIKRTAKLPGKKRKSFDSYVVAIGASAGGLDALERFFDEMPCDSGAVFVVIQHLSPDHKSMMDNLLARHTAMPVWMAEDGMEMTANHVYLIPPGKSMTVEGSQLRLLPKNPHGLSLPIDMFFTSLAKAFGNRAVGAILSGTGSDGSRGAVAINDAGGFLLAQYPESAKFDGMPRSVIATGLVDEVMPPGSLAIRIDGHVRDTIDPQIKTPPAERGGDANPMNGILQLLYAVTGVNFNEYKSGTVERRIERRMQVRHVRDLEDYLNVLKGDQAEIHTLKRDILIPVTSFFRDPPTFEILQQEAINTILGEQPERLPVRVWVAGCASGEEAYTIAILFAEACEQLKRWPSVKIFATDVEQQSIDLASAGVYAQAIVNEIAPERLERFFTSRGTQFLVKSEIRQNIVFARHNLLEDPPFTRMNLVSCRNTLIYFDSTAQERALLRLQYALNLNGHLLLGSSESLGALQRDFTVTSSKHKLYRLLRPVALPLDMKNKSVTPVARTQIAQIRRDRLWESANGKIAAAQSLLLKQYSPAALLVNADRDLLHVFGDAHRFMQIPEGAVSLDIAKLLIGKLSSLCVALLHKSAKENTQLRSEVALVHPSNGVQENICLVVTPMEADLEQERTFLLAFETPVPLALNAPGAESFDLSEATRERIQSLERDLSVTRDSLQATIEELETANEELQATNEELMASNEELQSTNEELQSVNEELYTINSENQETIELLNRLNADLDNMTRAALIPTVFVDTKFKLTRFTPEAGTIFRIREGDIGRPIDDFSHCMDYPDFMADLQRIMDGTTVIEREVKTNKDRWFLTKLLPYVDRTRKIGGAVLTLFEITMLKDAQRLQAILDSLPEHIAVLDSAGLITVVNKAWRDFATANGDRGLHHTGPGINYLDVCRVESGPDAEDAKQVLQGIERVRCGQQEQYFLKYPCHSPTQRRWFLMHAAPVHHPAGGVVISHINITDWVEGNQSND